MQSNMITVNQDEYMRMLNLLEYQANFILSNSLMNLVESWPKEPQAMFGILI